MIKNAPSSLPPSFDIFGSPQIMCPSDQNASNDLWGQGTILKCRGFHTIGHHCWGPRNVQTQRSVGKNSCRTHKPAEHTSCLDAPKKKHSKCLNTT